jgi:hypothetical protein
VHSGVFVLSILLSLLLSLSLLLLLPGAKEFVPWDQVGTRVPELLEQIQVGCCHGLPGFA